VAQLQRLTKISRAESYRAAIERSAAGVEVALRGNSTTMIRRTRSLVPVVWVVVGVVVAAVQDYFDSLGTTGRVLTAIAAVLLWPILLFGFDISIGR
jgi:hypothetical protein